MTVVYFYCKKNTKNEKIISSISLAVKSTHYKFSPNSIVPKVHPKEIRKLVEAKTYKNCVHLPYNLQGSLRSIYIDPKTKKFWFDGNYLPPVTDKKLSRQKSSMLLNSFFLNLHRNLLETYIFYFFSGFRGGGRRR